MKKVILPHWIKPSDVISDCSTVEDFAYKYRKPDRFTGRGDEYVEAVLQTHREEMKQKGWSNISHHDTITGTHVVFVDPQNEIVWQTKNQSAKPKDATT